MTPLALALCLIGASLQAAPAVQPSTAPVILEGARFRPGPTELHQRFLEAVDEETRRSVLTELARSKPESLRDVSSLFDLFMRFSRSEVRDAALSALARLSPADSELEPAFMEYLKLPESDAKIFGVEGACRLRSLRALPIIRKIAEQRFAYKSPGEAPVLTDKSAWLAQFQALSALAQWRGAEALPLLRRQALEAPAVAKLMAVYLWKDSLPQFVKWAGSARTDEPAHEGLAASVPLPALRETRGQMLALMRNPKTPREARHQLAVKVGVCSGPGEVDALLVEETTATDPELKLGLATALFASRDPKTIPWLKTLRTADPDPKLRLGALMQLRLLLPPAEARPLIEATAAQDPDPENRQSASDMLREPAVQ